MLSEHPSKLAAQEQVISSNVTLKSLKIIKLAKMVATATITVSKETTRVAVANKAVDGAGIVAAGTTEPEQGTTNTTKLRQSTLGKKAKTDIELFFKAVIHTYWHDYGQFRDTTNRKTGHYSNSIYTDVKEYLSYNTAHYTDLKMKAIMLEGVNAFDAIFQKHEKISIQNPKATLSAITAFISKLLVIPLAMDIRDVQLKVEVLY